MNRQLRLKRMALATGKEPLSALNSFVTWTAASAVPLDLAGMIPADPLAAIFSGLPAKRLRPASTSFGLR